MQFTKYFWHGHQKKDIFILVVKQLDCNEALMRKSNKCVVKAF